jgi:hypothetical protein
MSTAKKEVREISQGKRELIELSGSLKTAQEFNQLPKQFENCVTTNDLLKVYYSEKSEMFSPEMKTFNQWKQEGKIVRKGEHGFKFWTAPIKAKGNVEIEGTTEEKKYSFFNVCYLFSDKQVD